MKLTKEEIARVFAMYLYRQLITPHGSRQLLSSYNLNYYLQFLHSCKIELTPLSSITDEHAIEVAKIAYPAESAKDLWTPENGKEYLNFSPNVSCMIYSIYQQLILLGYAVPLFFGLNHWANDKTAIELGIAIEQKTLCPS